MALDANDPRPKHRQIADWIVSEIVVGSLSPGERLPSARDLMDRFGVSNQTAQNAVKLLQSEGLAKGVPGRGTFLSDDIDVEALTDAAPDPGSAPSAAYVALSERLDEIVDQLDRVHQRLDELESAQPKMAKRTAKRS